MLASLLSFPFTEKTIKPTAHSVTILLSGVAVGMVIENTNNVIPVRQRAMFFFIRNDLMGLLHYSIFIAYSQVLAHFPFNGKVNQKKHVQLFLNCIVF